MKFYIETYGCTANFGNSRDAQAALLELGHEPSSLDEADAVIVNTCAVTEKTENKILRRLRRLEGGRLVIAGCLSLALPESVQQISCKRRIGMLNGTAAEKIADLFASPVLEETVPFRTRKSPHPVAEEDHVPQDLCGIVNIAEGCSGGCTYCIVQKARGRLVSRRPEDVVRAVQKLVGSGAVEIQLAAQDSSSYGMDIGFTLPDLLMKVVKVPGRFMVRVGMMNPDTIRPIRRELTRAFQNPKVYRFLHLPVQSGSNRVLSGMGRKYSRDDFLEIVNDFRAAIPDLFFVTDAIAGFPGETEGDFKRTLDLIRHLQPDKVNITRFSCRPGTAAARLYDMPDRIKKDRSRELTKLWLEIAASRNRRYEGQLLEVLVTERGRAGTMKARAGNYLGIVVNGTPGLGSSIKVKVTGSNPFFVWAREPLIESRVESIRLNISTSNIEEI